MNYWVIDTKVKILPESTFVLDGSDYYYTRSVVPSNEEDSEIVVSELHDFLKRKSIVLEQILAVEKYENKTWDADKDEDFETQESLLASKKTGEISLGCIVSELSIEE